MLFRSIFCNYFSANTFHSIRLILCFSKTGEIDNLTESLGQSILVVLCAGFRLLLTSRRHQLFFWRRCQVNQQHLQKRLPSPTGQIKPWFLTEGKLVVVLIIPFSWGSQRIAIRRASSSFSGTVAGEKKHFYKGSLSLSIFLLFYCFA